jgi:hypothetical protein
MSTEAPALSLDPAESAHEAPAVRRLPALPIGFFALFAVMYLYAFPYFDQLRSANEVPRVLMTQEIVDRGVFYLDHRTREFGSTLDTSWGPDGHLYPNKAPGPSFLAIPAYLVCKALGFTSLRACTWAFRVTAVILPALLFLPFFYRLTGRFAESEPARRTALLGYALGCPALIYGMLFFSHQLAAVFAGAAFIAAVALVRGTPRPQYAAALVGLFAALAVMMDYQSALAAAGVGLYVLVRSRRRVRDVFLVAMGALPPAALMAAYHTVCFGSPLKTGYSYSVDTVTRQGFMGIVGPSPESFWSTTFLPANGILVLAPWLLLGVLGAWSIWSDPVRRGRIGAEALVCLLIFGVYVLFLSSLVPYMARGGWCVGPRYMTVALPFMAWLAAAGFAEADRRPVTRVIALGLVLSSAVIFVSAVTTYPHWPDPLRNPLYELTFPLIARGYAVHSVGTWLGLRGVWATMPLYLLVAGTAFFLVGRGRGLRVTALACLIAALVVAGHRAFPLSGDYAKRAWSFVTATWEPKR